MCKRCNGTGRTKKLFSFTFCTFCHGTGSSAFENGSVTDLDYVIRAYHKENKNLTATLALYSNAAELELPVKPKANRLDWNAPQLALCGCCNGSGRYAGITGSMECGNCLGTGQLPETIEDLISSDLKSLYIATLADMNRWLNAEIREIKANNENLALLVEKHNLNMIANSAY